MYNICLYHMYNIQQIIYPILMTSARQTGLSTFLYATLPNPITISFSANNNAAIDIDFLLDTDMDFLVVTGMDLLPSHP